MAMDYVVWRFWLDITIAVLMGVNVIWTWLVNRTKANKAAIEQVDEHFTEEIGKVKDRVTQLESDVRHLPDHEDLGEIHEKVNNIATGMGEIKGELSALNNTMRLINEHLINHGK